MKTGEYKFSELYKRQAEKEKSDAFWDMAALPLAIVGGLIIGVIVEIFSELLNMPTDEITILLVGGLAFLIFVYFGIVSLAEFYKNKWRQYKEAKKILSYYEYGD